MTQKMNWHVRQNKYDARSTDGQIDWLVLPKKNGKYFVKAYLGGGAEHRLPFQEFETAEKAMDWAEAYDEKRYAANARYAKEESIKF